MAKLVIDQVDVNGKRVLTRVDFNVPLDADRKVTDDRRIRAALPTIRNILERGGKLILMSHLGRPEGKGYEEKYSLSVVAEKLSELLGKDVKFPSKDCLDDTTAEAAKSLGAGEVMLLENLRFYKGETKKDPEMAKRLASYGEVFCNDAFGTAHRSHTSMVGVPEAMPSAPHAAGFLMRDEIKYLSDTIRDPKRPFVAILGGAKVADKINAIENLLERVDSLLIGGAMAFTFLAATGRRIGRSLLEHESIRAAEKILASAAEHRGQLFLPVDHVCGKELSEHTPIRICDEHIEDGWMGLDIGVHTIVQYTARISDANTIVWNGPVGAFETPPFDVGTRCIGDSVSASTINGAVSVIGGGDSAAAVEHFGIADRFSHVSTGGGASLQMLEGRPLPGVEALTDA